MKSCVCHLIFHFSAFFNPSYNKFVNIILQCSRSYGLFSSGFAFNLAKPIAIMAIFKESLLVDICRFLVICLNLNGNKKR